MHPTRPQLLAVLAASERLLAARADKMLTEDECSALEQAVVLCTEAPPVEFRALGERETDDDVQGQPEAGPDVPAPTGA